MAYLTTRASELAHGALGFEPAGEGWERPVRFTPAQLRAFGSCRAWHPGLFRQMAACSAGVCLEFYTDGTRVAAEVSQDPFPRGTRAALADVAKTTLVPPERFDGVSVVVDGRSLGTQDVVDGRIEVLLDNPSEVPSMGMLRLPGMGERHHVQVWLPTLTSCSVRGVESDGTYIEPVPARRQLLVLGDSIAQGFVGQDPGMLWPARLARQLDLDLVNQGLGGQVFQPGSLVGLADEVDPAAIVVEFGENYRYEPCQERRVASDIRTYLYEVAEAWPDVPTWVLTPLYHTEDVYPTHPKSCADAIDHLIWELAGAHPQMRVVDGSRLLDEKPELLADRSDHPGPAGQEIIARRLGMVVEATLPSAKERRAAAIEHVSHAGPAALPILQALERGAGEVVFAEKSCVLVRFGRHFQAVWAKRRSLAKQVIEAMGARGATTCVCGKEALAADVARALGASRPRPCHLVYLPKSARLPQGLVEGRDIRTLGGAYAPTILEHYSHPEYLEPGELDTLLSRGCFLGAFDEGRLVGFVGEHLETSIGMLEVFPEAQKRGWGAALMVAKSNKLLADGYIPWAEVWPDNDASLGLMKKLGFTARSASDLWFIS